MKLSTFLLAVVAGLFCAARAAPPAGGAHTKYIMVMRSPGRGMDQARPETINRAAFEEVLRALPNRPDSRVQTGIAFIFSCFRTPPETTVRALRNFLRVAQETSTPVVVQLDFEQWWSARPDLWNWWAPGRPGYNPDNRLSVEWTYWSPDHAIKIAWRNWGRQLRVLPPPNLSSPRYLAACREQIHLLVPIIMQWYAGLPPARKQLLVAIKVGHESSIGTNAYYYPNGNDLLDQPAAADPAIDVVTQDVLSRGMQQIGYAAVKTGGIRTTGDITEHDLYEATRRYIEFLCRETAACGVPRDRLFSHGGGWATGELLYDAAVNEYSCPGWSFYTHAADPLAEPAVVRALKRSDAPYWGAVEWLLLEPEDMATWKAAMAKTLADDRCRFLCIFNWEGIRDSAAIKAAISELVDENAIRGGANTAAAIPRSRETQRRKRAAAVPANDVIGVPARPARRG